MERQVVSSSMLKSVGHDPNLNILEVEYNTGGVYRFEQVSAEEHQALLNADSIGKHFHSNIKKTKIGRRVE